MRISDWSSDVCSSDLPVVATAPTPWASSSATLHDVARASKLDRIRSVLDEVNGHRARAARKLGISERTLRYRLAELRELAAARKGVVEGKSVSVLLDSGGRRNIKKKKKLRYKRATD